MRLFRRKTLDERLAIVLVRAMEREFPQQWSSLSEARKPRVPKDFEITAWDMTHTLGYHGDPQLTVTLQARGWPSWR